MREVMSIIAGIGFGLLLIVVGTLVILALGLVFGALGPSKRGGW